MSSIIRATTTSGLQVAPDNSGSLQLQTNGTTTAVTIDTSQNVGIGTTSPSSYGKLAVSGVVGISNSSSSGYAWRYFRNTSTPTAYCYDDGTNVQLTVQTAGALLFGTNDTERMRIDSSGNLLVGTTSSFGSYTRLSAQAPDTLVAIGAYRATTSTGYDIQQFRSDVGGTNTIKYAVYANGTAGAVSDVTKKKNIESARNYLNDLQSIRVVKYNWNTDDDSAPKELGFIAQEVETVFPGMVATTEDGTKILKKEVFVPMLIKAIQEQQTIINDLKARIETLEAK